MLTALLLIVVGCIPAASAQYAADWADLTNGLAGSSITYPSDQGVTGRFVLLVSIETLCDSFQ
jgi:hypothetical protein